MDTFGSMWRKKQDLGLPVLSNPAPIGRVEVKELSDSLDDYRFIARQAIFDRTRNVLGYELLARTGWENRFSGDSDAATRKMISDGVLYGFEGLTRGRLGFINCTRESLVEGLVTLLPKTTVLEILETVAPDEEVIDACRHIKEQGYKIALDDFRINPEMQGLVEFADYVKVDFRLSDAAERKEILAYLKGSKATLVAEKIETEEEFRIALAEGFDLFQGYFFCHPTVFSAKRAPATGNNYFRLLAGLSKKSVNYKQMTELLKSEVTICYQLLRLVNSAAFGLSAPVQSIEKALMLVGEDQFRKLVLNAIAVESCKKHPDELLIRVLQRARFLELMAPYTRENAQEQYLFGLLSLMGVMLDMPIGEVIKTLPLRNELKAALDGSASGPGNSVTTALRLLESYEDGDWANCIEMSHGLKISEGKLTHIYEQSVYWAEQAASPERESVS